MNKEKAVFIVASGTSLTNFDFFKLKNKDTIVINQGIFYVPNPTYFITMDYIFLTKRLKRVNKMKDFRKSKAFKFFVANMENKTLIEKNGKIADIRWNTIYNLDCYDKVIKSYKRKGLGFNYSDFRNGGNSGHCALQLAILLKYKKIYLLGFDFRVTKRTHFHNDYKNIGYYGFQGKLNKYYKNFVEAIIEVKKIKPKIEIYNCSKISRLKTILQYKEI